MNCQLFFDLFLDLESITNSQEVAEIAQTCMFPSLSFSRGESVDGRGGFGQMCVIDSSIN